MSWPQRQVLTSQMEEGPILREEGPSLSEGGRRRPGPPRGPWRTCFPCGFLYFLFPCALRKFLFLPCTQSLTGEDKGRRHHEWGPCGRQVWGSRRTRGSAEHTLHTPPRPREPATLRDAGSEMLGELGISWPSLSPSLSSSSSPPLLPPHPHPSPFLLFPPLLPSSFPSPSSPLLKPTYPHSPIPGRS